MAKEQLEGVEEPKCLEDAVPVDRMSLVEAWSALSLREENIVDLLLYKSGGLEVFARVFISTECFLLVYVIAKSCGEGSGGLLKLSAEAPEVSRVSIRGDCVEAMVPPTPEGRVGSFLDKLGLRGDLRITAYRIPGEGGL
ncbi:MAG: hypothetical protein LRS43_02970 [Desulfurococcales archaeon]|nr:hypothetical protein [Desulfurococcales archaeon]